MTDLFYVSVYLFALFLFAAYHVRAWRRSSPSPPPEQPGQADLLTPSPPQVSVLVPAWNAAPDLAAFVRSYHRLRYPNKELILCAGGADGSYAAALELAAPKLEGENVRVLEQHPGEGKQGGLAKCFAASTGSVIYLTDIDCLLDDESLTRVLSPILTGREHVVTGSSKPNAQQRTVGAVLVHWALVRKAEGVKGRYVGGILGRNCAVTREALEAVGGFSFAAPTGTDYRLAQELIGRGYRIWLEPKSEIQTAYAWPLSQYIRKRGRWVRNVLLFAERPRQRAEFYNALSVALLPAVMLAALLLSLVAALFLPLSVALLPAFIVLVLLLHGALNRLRYVRETLGETHLSVTTVRGAFVNWLGQLSAGLYALFTWSVPSLRKQW